MKRRAIPDCLYSTPVPDEPEPTDFDSIARNLYNPTPEKHQRPFVDAPGETFRAREPPWRVFCAPATA